MKNTIIIAFCFLAAVGLQIIFTSVAFYSDKLKHVRYFIQKRTFNQSTVVKTQFEHDYNVDRPFYIFSIIGINSTRAARWDTYLVNGWESDSADSHVYMCCYLFPNRIMFSSKQSDKRRFNYFRSDAVNARQIVCTVRNRFVKDFPIAVSLITNQEPCDANVQFYKPVYALAPPTGTSGFAVHGKVSYGDKDPAHLIEWLEYQRYFGVDKVLIYPYHLNSKAMDVLSYYAERGFVEVIPFSTVPKLETFPRMFGVPRKTMIHDEQVINYDAQGRLAGYKYFTIIDTDEFIVPVNRTISTFTHLMEYLIRKHNRASRFVLLTQMHFTSWAKTNETSQLLMTQYGNHSESFFNAPKSLLITDRIAPGSVSIHTATGHKGYTMQPLSDDYAVLKHYRSCRNIWLISDETYNHTTRCHGGFRRIKDVYMDRIGQEILPKVLEVRRILGI